MYRTYSYNDMPMPILRQRENVPAKTPPEKSHGDKEKSKKHDADGIFDKLKTDDIILIAVALALLCDDCDDKLLLIALAFIFFSGWF